jgi:hypothetical protein
MWRCGLGGKRGARLVMSANDVRVVAHVASALWLVQLPDCFVYHACFIAVHSSGITNNNNEPRHCFCFINKPQ